MNEKCYMTMQHLHVNSQTTFVISIDRAVLWTRLVSSLFITTVIILFADPLFGYQTYVVVLACICATLSLPNEHLTADTLFRAIKHAKRTVKMNEWGL